MKCVFAFTLLMLCAVAAAAQNAPAQSSSNAAQPSLGEVVRKLQQNKATTPAHHDYTNDNLPHGTIVNVAGNATSAPDKVAAPDKTNNTQTDSKVDVKKVNADWSAKIAEQKKQIAGLEHELELMQREYQLRVASFYWDAGSRLRDDKKWTEEEQKHNDDVAERTAKLQAARDTLDQLREQARKAGVPQTSID